MKSSIGVFISSTRLDLQTIRERVERFIDAIGLVPLQMERFNPKYEPSPQKIRHDIESCDYFILIVGDRYGTMHPDGLSYTEWEFRLAKELGKEILVFVKPIRKNDTTELAAFKRRVLDGGHVELWKTTAQLETMLTLRATRWIIDSLREARENETTHREVYTFLFNHLNPFPDIELTREFLQYLGGKDLSAIDDVLDLLGSLLTNFVQPRIPGYMRAYFVYRLSHAVRTIQQDGEPIEALYRLAIVSSEGTIWPKGLPIVRDSNVNRVFETRRVQRVPNAMLADASQTTPNQHVSQEGSVIAAPIVIDGVCIGVIGISSPKVDEVVTPPYRRLAAELEVIFSALFYAYSHKRREVPRPMTGQKLRNEITRYFDRRLPALPSPTAPRAA